MVYNKFFIIYISLFNIIISLKLNVNKNHINKNQLLKIHSLNNKFLSNKSSIRSLIYLPIEKYEISLYTIKIKIGEQKQEFSLILDSGSSYIWAYDNDCTSCKSKNKFNSTNSKTLIRSEKTIKLNYISGNIKGNLCQDTIYYEQSLNKSIKSFYFLLVDESNLDFELDGIIGLSKGSFDKKYSFLYQLKDKKLIKNSLLLYDLFNKSFYIDEIPQFYLQQKSISCELKNDNSNFWKCDINFIKIDNIPISMETEIIFDSGTNGIIFPLKYKNILENIIKNNKILKENKCELQGYENDNIYEIICNQTLKYDDVNTTNNFLEIYLDKGQNNSIEIKLTDLLGEDNKAFYLFIIKRKSEILLGSPFFEKYPVLFDLDENIVNIFGTGNNLYKYRNYKEEKVKKIKIIIIIVISVLIILILVRIRCIYRRRNSNYNQVEFLVGEIK